MIKRNIFTIYLLVAFQFISCSDVSKNRQDSFFYDLYNGEVSQAKLTKAEKILNGLLKLKEDAMVEHLLNIMSYCEIKSKAEFINKFNSIAKTIGKGNLKQISFAGHSDGQYIFGGFDFQRDIEKLDLTVLAPGAKVIYGQCGATVSVTALKTELIKQFDDTYAKEMQEKMQGITIYSRDHTASFNGQFKIDEAIDYLTKYLEFGLIKGWDKSTFINGRFIDSTLPYPAYNVLTNNQEYISNNNAKILEYEGFIADIKDSSLMNDVNSLNAVNLKLSNFLQQNPHLSKWVEIRSSFIKTMTSTYDNYPIPVNERG